MNLDKFQTDVVTSNNNLLVVAGPGSGKTTTIINKVEYLCSKGFENDILLISFTNKSVDDIKSRLKYNVDVFTFHGLAIDILKYNKFIYQICDTNLINYITDEYIKRFSKEELNKLCIYLGLSKFKYNSREYESLKKLINTFINLFKTNNKTVKDLKVNSFEDKYLLKIILNIFLEYEEEKNSTYCYDFDDLIIKSTSILKSKYNYKKYKYIIVDEFQDTSLIRLNLIKVIYDNSNSIITAVGDDCQSIFRFSGCDLSIFLKFNNYFSNVKTIYLKNTYRNSQTLIDISEKFINKNPFQLKKQMISKIPDNNPIEIVYYLNSKKALSKLLDKINDNDILIISRNKYDINEYLNNDLIYDDNNIIYKSKHYKYMSIHSSKGLEAKYVIILNCSNKLLGLPNKIENHKILDLISNNEDNFPFSEERRVFFVAITRCKVKTILLTPYDSPSPFVKEIKKMLFKHL